MLIDPNNVIVCQKHKQTIKQKMLGIFLHVFFWGILLYLFLTLLVIGGYFLGYSFPNQILIDYQDIAVIKAVIKRYFPVIGVACAIFLSWALYNKLRFHGKHNRRKNHPVPVNLAEVTKSSKLEMHDVQNMRHAKVMTCFFDDSGNIIGVKCDEIMPPIEVKEDFYVDIEILVPQQEEIRYEKVWA